MDNSKTKTFFKSFTGYERPVRLRESTRKLAADYLSGRYGKIKLDNLGYYHNGGEDFDQMSDFDKYDFALQKIVETAPVSIYAHELIVGSASYGGSVWHRVPFFNDGDYVFNSVSHTTIGFDEILLYGVDEIERRIKCKTPQSESEERYKKSLICTIEGLRIWHSRYIGELKKLIKSSSQKEAWFYKDRLTLLKNVPLKAPASFKEGIQSLWFLFAFVRLLGNWPGIGRIDKMLGGLLEKDLKDGTISLEEAREYVAHFFIKGTEWCNGIIYENSSGDAQHYQNLILGGIDAAGNDVANQLTYLILEVLEELPISDYPVAVRVSERTPEKLIRRIVEAQKFGSGTVAVYQEDVVIEGLKKAGMAEAADFTNDGCWEVLIPGRTAFIYIALDGLIMLTRDVLNIDGAEEPADYKTYEELYAALTRRLSQVLDEVNDSFDNCFLNGPPSSAIDIFQKDCIENLRGYHNRGCKYTNVSPHLGGFADIVNSLLVIKELVYEQKKYTLREFLKIVKNDYENEETLRQEILNSFVFFGNNSDYADEIAVRFFNDYTEMVGRCKNRKGVNRLAGISTFGRQIEWSKVRPPSPHGFKRNSILANNIGPTPGTDKEGAAAYIQSCCKPDFTRLPCGCAMDVKLLAQQIEGENGITVLMSLIKAFIQLKGFYMHTDLIDNEILKDAQLHPENYPNLSVRLSGWSSRFVTLCKEWQDMIIGRT